MTSVEDQYASLRKAAMEPFDNFNQELLGILKEIKSDDDADNEADNEADKKEFDQMFGPDFMSMVMKMADDMDRRQIKWELEHAVNIQNGVPLEVYPANVIEPVWKYFTSSQMAAMSPEVLAHHIEVLKSELAAAEKTETEKVEK